MSSACIFSTTFVPRILYVIWPPYSNNILLYPKRTYIHIHMHLSPYTIWNKLEYFCLTKQFSWLWLIGPQSLVFLDLQLSTSTLLYFSLFSFSPLQSRLSLPFPSFQVLVQVYYYYKFVSRRTDTTSLQSNFFFLLFFFKKSKDESIKSLGRKSEKTGKEERKKREEKPFPNSHVR